MFKKYAIYLSFLFVITFIGKSFSHYVQVIPDSKSITDLENIIQLLAPKVLLSDEIMFYKRHQFHMTLNTDFIKNKINLNVFDRDNIYDNVKDISVDIKGIISRITFKVIDVIPLGNDNNKFIALQLRPILSCFSKIEKNEIKKQLLLLLKKTPHITIMKCSPDFDTRDLQSLVEILSKHFRGYNIFIKFEELKIFAEQNNRTLSFMF